MPLLCRLAVALLAFVAVALPAAAMETGTKGWLIKGQSLFEGPGRRYEIVGQLGDATEVRVDRCAPLWCLVRAGRERGWVGRHNVSFGQEPRHYAPLRYPSGATVCLYEGRNFTGPSLCLKSGTVIRDLLLMKLDNRFSSIRLNGGSATLCRDRDFTSYCERVIDDQAALYGFLDNGVTSVRVW